MMKWMACWLLASSLSIPALADPLDDIVAGQGDAKAVLSGLVVANGNSLGGITVAKGCARFKPDGLSCAEALTPQHMLRIASISKLVTALGAMKLVEQGKLSLNADVSRYLGFSLRNPNFPKTPITLAQLLSHTSSLRDSETYWADYPDTLKSLFGKNSVHYAADKMPGAFFTYTNLNYGVIATIIERVSGERFDRYMQRVIFKPMGITAGYNWSGVVAPFPPVAALYKKTAVDGPWLAGIDDFGGGAPKVTVRSKANVVPDIARLASGSNGTLFSPQGGLRISIQGLGSIAHMLANCGRHRQAVILRCSTINTMAEPFWKLKPDFSNGADEAGFYQAYGLGAQRFHIDDTRELMLGHYADAYGLRGALIVNPATKKYAVYLFTGVASDPNTLKSDMPGLSTPEAALTKFLLPFIK
jgi:CubicO group peptidase (beta-lactamase class C family)